MRIAVADDGDLFRDGLVLLLRATGHDVVCSVRDGDALLAEVAAAPVDVAVLDIRMPPGEEGGLTTARRLRASAPDTGLLLLSHYAESHYLMQVLEVGPHRVGYRLKDKVTGVGALVDTLERLSVGEIVIEPEVAGRLVSRAQPDAGGLGLLNEREHEVLRRMAEGCSNASIATDMYLSVKAVEKHIATIFAKLQLPDDATVYHRRVLAVLAHLRGRTSG